MTLYGQITTSLGLILEIVGAATICVYGFPEGFFSPRVEQFPKESNAQKNWERHRWGLRFGLFFVVAGLACQLIGLWVP